MSKAQKDNHKPFSQAEGKNPDMFKQIRCESNVDLEVLHVLVNAKYI